MLPRLDTESIRTNADLVAIAGGDVSLTEHTGYHSGPCPFCREGEDRFKVFDNDDGQYFYCRKCGRRGDAIQYLMMRDNLDFVGAAKRLNAAELPESPRKSRENGSQRPLDGENWQKWQYRADLMATDALKALANGLSDEIQGARRWLHDRGIGQQEIITLGLGYNDQWREVIPGYKLPPGITIPRWCADDVRMTAINVYLNREARQLTGQRRMYLKGSRPKKCLFNEWRIDDDISTVIICEGELDAVLLSRFLPPVALAVAAGGAGTIPDDLSLLDGKQVILCLDNDEAGQEGRMRWLERLPAATVATVPAGNDITDYWKAGGDIAEWIGEHIGWEPMTA